MSGGINGHGNSIQQAYRDDPTESAPNWLQTRTPEHEPELVAPPFKFHQAAEGDSITVNVWLRLHGPDLITLAALGVLGLGIYAADPAPMRSFPVFNTAGNIVYPQFAYPLRHEIVPIWAAALLAGLIPFFFFCLFQIRRRSLIDLLDTTMGLLKSLITAAVFQVFLKWLIGGLRPHFYDVCKPHLHPGTGGTTGSGNGNGFQAIMYDRTICTGDPKAINDALESFPSGHSTAAFAGFVYLTLYFNAQLKVMAAHNPQYWKMILFFAPLLGATLIAGALTIDEYHNWYDVVAGGIIGTLTALVAFRQTFASIWDFRFNHVRLPRTSSLFYHSSGSPGNSSGSYGKITGTAASAAAAFSGSNNTPLNGGPDFFAYYYYHPQPSAAGAAGVVVRSSMLPFAREGGWSRGAGGATVGAPGDATALYRGSGQVGMMGGEMNDPMLPGVSANGGRV